MKNIFLLSFIPLAVVANCHAQEKIDTDRPDQTESVATAPRGWLQAEIGFNLQKNGTNNEYLLPTTLLKYGLTKRMELRLVSSVRRYQFTQVNGSTGYENGIEPIAIGTKLALCEEKGILPKTSILAHIAFPALASKNLQADKLAPEFRLCMQHTITKNMGLAYNLGAEWDGFNNEPGWVYSISPGFGFLEKWYAYIEAFGVVSKIDEPEHNMDAGFAYWVNSNFKLDASGGIGISKAAPQWYIAVGASFRFKTH